MFFIKIFDFNICFLFGVRYFYFYKYFSLFPVLLPRNETGIFFNFISIIFDEFFIFSFFESGFGSGIFCITIGDDFLFNVIGIDCRFYTIFLFYKNIIFYKFNFFMIFNCEWFYLFFSCKNFNIIFSNPPYLGFSEKLFFFDFSCECKYSLISNVLGLFDLFFLAKVSYYNLSQNGIFILEHSYAQARKIRSVLNLIGFVNIYTLNDSSGLNRFTVAEK